MVIVRKHQMTADMVSSVQTRNDPFKLSQNDIDDPPVVCILRHHLRRGVVGHYTLSHLNDLCTRGDFTKIHKSI